jgi:hypothetical protein
VERISQVRVYDRNIYILITERVATEWYNRRVATQTHAHVWAN